jgi:ABC-type iron transport system FetAB ATPase subunit
MTRLAIRSLRSALAGPFDLELACGGCIAVGGASGSGKSLFLRMIADLDPNQGEVLLDGTPRDSMPAPQWRSKVCYVAAESPWWTERVLDHFAPEHRDRARALAARLGLGEAQVDGIAALLSTGERQRLAVIRALVLQPPVLLLDEPTGPLDPDSTAQVEVVLKEAMAAGAGLILVTHDPQQAVRLGSVRYTMKDRRLEPAS